jgi:hypothetical protein
MITKQQLAEFVTEARTGTESFHNCGAINRDLKQKIETKFNIPVQSVKGGLWKSRADREEHFFLKIDSEYIENVSSTVIVDGAIKQFCEENEPDVWVSLGSKEDLPSVAVLDGTEDKDWYSMYLEQTP